MGRRAKGVMPMRAGSVNPSTEYFGKGVTHHDRQAGHHPVHVLGTGRHPLLDALNEQTEEGIPMREWTKAGWYGLLIAGSVGSVLFHWFERGLPTTTWFGPLF